MTAGIFFLFIFALAVSTLIGYFVVALLWPMELPQGIAWAIAPGIGAGICSLVGFIFRRPMFTVEFALLIALSAWGFVRGGMRLPQLSSLTSWRPPVVGLFFACALGVILSGLMIRVNQMPHGDWDAFAIWNSHARELFRAGATWQTEIQDTFHADYPLLTPLMTARFWRYAGEEAPEAGGLLGILFTLSGVAVLLATLAELRDTVLAMLVALLLLGTPFYLEHGMSQSADVPLSFFMLSTVALICLDSRRTPKGLGLLVLAGFTAGCAGWTKNEGLLFILAAGIVLLLPVVVQPARTLRRFAAFFGGLIVPLAVIVYFKIMIAPQGDITGNRHYAEVVEKILTPDRYVTILHNFASTFWTFGGWTVQPAIALLAFILVRGIDRGAIRSFAWLASAGILVTMLAGYAAVYVVTPMELQWHIDSSLPRLFLQLWPLLLLIAGLAARRAETIAT